MTEYLDRKAAIRAYKERKPRPGIYALRERNTGWVWTGSSPNLDTTRNGLWLQLNLGRHLDKELQAAWTRFGEVAFAFEILEVIEEELSPLVLKETLKAKRAEWAALYSSELQEPR